MRSRAFLACAAGILCTVIPFLFALRSLAQQPAGGSWVTAWSTSHHSLSKTTISNATVRLMVQPGLSGDAVRIRLDNTFGTTPIRIGKASAGLRMRGARVVAGSSVPVLFDGEPKVTIPPGGSVVSDLVPLKVVARQDLAISLYLPETEVNPTEHTMALTTSYLTPNGSGDATGVEAGTTFKIPTTAMYWLKAVDVMAAPGAAAAVALGDSITDGVCATVDGHDTWPEWLALRLDLEGKRRIAVLNEGINGNTLIRFPTEPPFPVGMTSIPVVERLDRDVFSHSGVKYLVLFIGTNDIRRGPSASQIIEGMESVIRRARERGLRVYGATIVPRHVAKLGTPGNPGWSAEASRLRQEINTWMRSKKGRFDALFDFDQVVRDPANHDLILPPHNCDDIHLSPRGYFEVARSVRLDLFNMPARR